MQTVVRGIQQQFLTFSPTVVGWDLAVRSWRSDQARGRLRVRFSTAVRRFSFDREARSREVAESGLFGPLEQRLLPWETTLSSQDVRRFLASFSRWIKLDEQVREPLLDEIEQLVTDEFGGSVQRPYVTAVYSTQAAKAKRSKWGRSRP